MDRSADSRDLADYVEELSDYLAPDTIVLAVRFGSELYGTNSAESDTDLRIVVLPSEEKVLTGQTEFNYTLSPRGRKLKVGDMDVQITSFQSFIHLLGDMDPASLEVLFASQSPHGCIKTSLLIKDVYNSRHRLIGTQSNAPIRLAKANLGNMIEDVDSTGEVIDALMKITSHFLPRQKLRDFYNPEDQIWADLTFELQERSGSRHLLNSDEAFNTVGTCTHSSVFLKVGDLRYDINADISAIRNSWRGSLQKRRKPTDQTWEPQVWKKIYQGIRICDQLIELAADEQITFPRALARTLSAIKNGQVSSDEATKHARFYYQNALEAMTDISLPAERSLSDALNMITSAHRSVITR